MVVWLVWPWHMSPQIKEFILTLTFLLLCVGHTRVTWQPTVRAQAFVLPKLFRFFFNTNCFTSIVFGIERFLVAFDEYLNKCRTENSNLLQILLFSVAFDEYLNKCRTENSNLVQILFNISICKTNDCAWSSLV